MSPPEKSTSGEGWWWAWRAWLVLSLAWLGACLWLGREPATWTQGWVGWWTGDRTGLGAIRSGQPYLTPGTEVLPVEGDPVFRVSGLGLIGLGHWQERRIPWTWAGWVRVNTASGEWPTDFLAVRSAIAPGSTFHLGFAGGRPTAELRTSTAGDATDSRMNLELHAAQDAQLGRWMHLAFSTDGSLLRVLVDGVPVVERTWSGEHGPALHLAALRLRGDVRGEAILSTRADTMTVEHDDVVIFQRALPPGELAALAGRGRGAWARELDRRTLAHRIWNTGWPVALLVLGVLLSLQVRPQLRRWTAEAAWTLAQPMGRPVRWVLVCGGLIMVVLTVALLGHARRSDEARFAEMTAQLRGETDSYWEKIAAFLMRARDWVAVQPELSQERWEAWLKANHFPHEYPGVIGIGYAEQALPGGLAAHEARWSAEHGFAYRVSPVPGPEREVARQLDRNPLLPVVLYAARDLDRSRWFTNGSILGRDLLHRPSDDPRSWCEGRRVETAVANNEITSSALEIIAPAGWYGGAIEGLRLYAPWTLRAITNLPGRVVPIEPSAWRGVLFASVDLREPLRDRYGSGSTIGCRFFEGGMAGDVHDLLVDSGDLVPATADQPDAMLRGRLKIPFYHHRLYVDVWTTRAFEALSFRRWAWIAGACSGGLTLLASALLLVQARARARQERVLESLRAANSELLLTYRERDAMSRDLHDGSIQNLYALGLHLQRVQLLLGTAPARVADELKNSRELLNLSIAELRQFILSAGVDKLDQHTVAVALTGLVERLRATTPVELRLHAHPDCAALEPRAGVEVLNIVREAVSNALRHAAPRQVTIRLEPVARAQSARAWWRLEVADDGTGFDPAQANGSGRGLKNFAARAAELGGHSRIDSTPSSGTRVSVEFPA